jgi:ankyrin repeat protein
MKIKETNTDKINFQTLIGVCKRGDLDSIKYWISRNKNQLNLVTENKENPLLSSVLNQHFEVVELLVSEGADTNITIDNKTLLGWCFLRNDFKMALLLNNLGCSFDINNDEQRNSLLSSFESSFYSNDLKKFMKKNNITFSSLIK